MLNLGAGARAFSYWARMLRKRARAASPMDAAEKRRLLVAARKDTDAIAQTVRKDGVAVLPGYWPADRCALARAEIDRIIATCPQSVQARSNGADKRVFGVESVSDLLMDFHADPFLQRFGELIGGLDIYNFATLGARIEATRENAGSGEGWHRDAHGFQFKAIIYLSDTSMDNGPFQYLVGSHKLWRAVTDSMVVNVVDPQQTRFTDNDIARLAARNIEQRAFPGKAGTLLLVNTAGIHRGMPLESAERYALTNYYYDRDQIDEGRLVHFGPMVPGTVERISRDLLAAK